MVCDLKKIRELIEPIISSLGCQLVDVRTLTEQGRWTLRVLIDREGGVTVGDCQKVSREIETPLEIEELVPERCYLEVSTPGLDRPLVSEQDFQKQAGRQASIRLKEPLDGRRNFKGRLEGIREGHVMIFVDGKSFELPFAAIEKANLVF